jgi:hypothetical protein
MKMLIILASLIGVAALTGGAGPAGKAAVSAPPGVDAAALTSTGAGKCFYRRDVRNHTVGDAHTLYFDVAGREVWRVQMSNPCLASAVSSDPLIIRNDTGGQSVCRPIDLDITVSAGGPLKCIVSSIQRLSPAEVAALPKRTRP